MQILVSGAGIVGDSPESDLVSVTFPSGTGAVTVVMSLNQLSLFAHFARKHVEERQAKNSESASVLRFPKQARRHG
jgi:hypothetical protein